MWHQKEIPITLREVIDLIEKYYAALLGTLYPNLTDEMFAGLVELSATSKMEKIIKMLLTDAACPVCLQHDL